MQDVTSISDLEISQFKRIINEFNLREVKSAFLKNPADRSRMIKSTVINEN